MSYETDNKIIRNQQEVNKLVIKRLSTMPRIQVDKPHVSGPIGKTVHRIPAMRRGVYMVRVDKGDYAIIGVRIIRVGDNDPHPLYVFLTQWSKEMREEVS